MYCAIEGIDTAGKSTQLELLKKALPEAYFTREPGGTTLGATIRSIVLNSDNIDEKSRFLLFLADRAEHAAQLRREAADRLILSDRSVVSGIAYASPLFSWEETLAMNHFATGGTLPERIVLLKLSAEELQRRLALKQSDAIEAKEGIGGLLTIQERLERAARALGCETLILDAALPIDDIHAKIKKFITL